MLDQSSGGHPTAVIATSPGTYSVSQLGPPQAAPAAADAGKPKGRGSKKGKTSFGWGKAKGRQEAAMPALEAPQPLPAAGPALPFGLPPPPVPGGKGLSGFRAAAAKAPKKAWETKKAYRLRIIKEMKDAPRA